MAELEEKLNAILGNPDAMGQIMALARSLNGGGDSPAEQSAPPPEPGESPPPPPVSQTGPPDLSALLGEMDPRLMQPCGPLSRRNAGRGWTGPCRSWG